LSPERPIRRANSRRRRARGSRGCVVSWSRGLCPAKPRDCGTARPPSPYPPKEPFLGIHYFVVVRDARVPGRLFLAEAEDAEVFEAVEEEFLYAVLQRAVEVDQHVAAEDHVEVIEAGIGDEVVL